MLLLVLEYSSGSSVPAFLFVDKALYKMSKLFEKTFVAEIGFPEAHRFMAMLFYA